MGDTSDQAIVDALRRQMTLAAARQAVAASNLANANTPGFRARQVEFSGALARQLGELSLATTTDGHRAGSTTSDGVKVAEATDLPVRRDGNTVQIDRELLTMSQASGQFAAAETALALKFRLVRYAINEGR